MKSWYVMVEKGEPGNVRGNKEYSLPKFPFRMTVCGVGEVRAGCGGKGVMVNIQPMLERMTRAQCCILPSLATPFL